MKIIGTRNNPTYATTTLSTDFKITISHPSGYLINSGYFPTITYLAARSTSYLYLTMTGTSYYQSVIADYTFTIQSTTETPLGGYIYFLFPVNFLETAIANTLPTPSTLTGKDFYLYFSILTSPYNCFFPPSNSLGSWTTDSLVYSTLWTTGTTYYTLQITPDFAWPAKTSLTLTFTSFTNPSTTTDTSLFSIYTMYDSKQVDTTDSTDTSLYFSYSE